jgi:glycine/D-amino acid oxidase-like deaminating enzyme
MGYSSDFVPHIGEVPDKPGQFIIAGFSGHGMPEILLSSKGLASIVRDGTAFEQTGLPRIFKTTKARVEAQGSPLEDSFSELWAKTPSPKL